MKNTTFFSVLLHDTKQILQWPGIYEVFQSKTWWNVFKFLLPIFARFVFPLLPNLQFLCKNDKSTCQAHFTLTCTANERMNAFGEGKTNIWQGGVILAVTHFLDLVKWAMFITTYKRVTKLCNTKSYFSLPRNSFWDQLRNFLSEIYICFLRPTFRVWIALNECTQQALHQGPNHTGFFTIMNTQKRAPSNFAFQAC